jgi:hypothetical protein
MEYFMRFSGQPPIQNLNGATIIAAKQKKQSIDSASSQIAVFVRPTQKLHEQELHRHMNVTRRCFSAKNFQTLRKVALE